jgi:integrase
LIAKYHENLFKSGSKVKFGTEMGQKNTKGTVTIINANGRIRLRWRYQTKRHSISLGAYSKSNLIQARIIALKIEQDMLLNNFDKTLFKYTGKVVAKPTTNKSFVNLFEEWVKDYKQMDCEVHTNYNATRNMLKKWGEITQENIVKKFNSETFCSKTYNRRLTILKNFINWLIEQNLWAFNPLLSVNNKKNKLIKNQNRTPFTEKEIQNILTAFKLNTACSSHSNFKHSHYYPFIYFIFKTGCRPSEAVGLRVSSIDLKNEIITIKEVLARTIKYTSSLHRVRKETKNGKIRTLPLNQDLVDVLKPLIDNKLADDLVFHSPKGKSIDDKNFQSRIFRQVLIKLEIPHRVLYACRHTFGSRCIDAGLTPVMTAFLMGNSPEVALKNYTHQLKIPNSLPVI